MGDSAVAQREAAVSGGSKGILLDLEGICFSWKDSFTHCTREAKLNRGMFLCFCESLCTFLKQAYLLKQGYCAHNCTKHTFFLHKPK